MQKKKFRHVTRRYINYVMVPRTSDVYDSKYIIQTDIFTRNTFLKFSPIHVRIFHVIKIIALSGRIPYFLFQIFSFYIKRKN